MLESGWCRVLFVVRTSWGTSSVPDAETIQDWNGRAVSDEASDDGTLCRWHLHNGESIEDQLRGHQGWVSCVAVSADAHKIISGSSDDTVRLWDMHTGESIREPLRDREGPVICIVVSADGEKIVSESWDGTVLRWDLHTGESIGEPIRGHEGAVSIVAVSGDGQKIISGSSDDTVRRWDLYTGESIGEKLGDHEGYVTSVAVSGDGQKIVFGSWDGTVRRWVADTYENCNMFSQSYKYECLISKERLRTKGFPMHCANDFRSLPLFSVLGVCPDFSHAVVGLPNGWVAVCKNVEDAM